jgi:hypothetical protein
VVESWIILPGAWARARQTLKAVEGDLTIDLPFESEELPSKESAIHLSVAVDSIDAICQHLESGNWLCIYLLHTNDFASFLLVEHDPREKKAARRIGTLLYPPIVRQKGKRKHMDGFLLQVKQSLEKKSIRVV